MCITIDLVAINVIRRDNKAGSTLVSNEHVKNARAMKSLAAFFCICLQLTAVHPRRSDNMWLKS